MEKMLHPLYIALQSVNKKAHINISKTELDNEEEGLEGQWLLDMLDQIIDELEITLKNSNQDEFSLTITHFNSLMGGPSADLWNTDELLIKVITKVPRITMNNAVFKSADYTVSMDKIASYVSFTSKRKREKCYILDKKLSLFLRKKSYVCISKHSIKTYDKNRQFKAAFNKDGSCNIEKTKVNLNKKLPYRNS